MSARVQLIHLPVEILLEIVSKIPYHGELSSRVQYKDHPKNDDFKNFKKSHGHIETIINEHEQTIARKISALQYPIPFHSLGWQVYDLRSIDHLIWHVKQGAAVIQIGKEVGTRMKDDTLSPNAMGWTLKQRNWEKIISIGLWLFQCGYNMRGESMESTAAFIDGLQGQACLIARFVEQARNYRRLLINSQVYGRIHI